MSKPTLLLPGSLKDPYGRAAKQKKFNKYERAVDYLIERYRESYDKSGANNKIFVLKAQTASGKSTANVAETFLNVLAPRGEQKTMIVTQPRIITAKANIPQITEFYEPHIELGRNIGWSTGSDKFRPREKPAILSVTVGTLTQQLQNWTDEEIINAYRFIMIDETHERSIEIDVTLFLLKSLFLRNKSRKDFPFIVLMSATFDAQPFIDYFGISRDNFIFVQGASQPINTHWMLKEETRSVGTTIGDVVRHIVLDAGAKDESDEADILIFLPGAGEIKSASAVLATFNEELAKTKPDHIFSLLQLDRRAVKTQNEDMKKLMAEPRSWKEKIAGKTVTPRRRIILSTAIAETGLTLNNLKYVLDVGFSR